MCFRSACLRVRFWFIDTRVLALKRAAVSKYRLGVCKMKKNRESPNIVRKSRQTISRKITVSSIGVLFYEGGDRVGLKALRSVLTGLRPYIT